MPSQLLSRQPRAGATSIPPGTRVQVGARSSLLWSASTVSSWAAAVGIGAIVVVGCWYAVGGKAQWDEQRSAMAVSIATVVLCSFASLSLLLTGRRAVGLRRIELLGDLPVPSTPVQVVQQDQTGGPRSETLVGSDGRSRYHRADCPMAVGRNYPEMSLSQHQAAGRMACGVCRP